MPSLIRELAVAGSHKSDGSANSSGKVFLYSPGTTTIVAGYKDDSLNEAWTTVAGGIPLDAGGRVKIWINDMVDVVISDADGATVDTMLGYNKTRAEQVEIENAGYTGNITDPATGAVSQGLGGITDLDTVLTGAFTSLGPNFQYLESSGATPRDYIDVITEIAISVKNFGAVGDGVHDDTAAIQATMDRVKALGGGVVYFPPGTYKISSALALSAATGVSIVGAGIQTTIITSTSGAANGFTFSTCDGLLLSRFSIRNSGTSTGKAISLDTCLRANVDRVHTGTADLSDGVYRYGIWASGCTSLTVSWSFIHAIAADAAGRGIYALDSAVLTTIGGELHATAGYPIEFDGIAGANMFGTGIAGSVRFAATMTLPLFFSFVGTLMNTAPSIATATIPAMRMLGTGIDASSTSSATSAAQTPSLIAGNEVLLLAASGGAGTVTVNAPALLPGTGSTFVDLYWDFALKNTCGGNATFDFNAAFAIAGGGTTIVVTNLHTTCVRFRWDRVSSKLREVSRADTVT